MKSLSAKPLRMCLTMIVLGLGSLATTPAVHAQTTLLRVRIPFAFEDGSRHFPAGLYTVSQAGHDMLLLRGSNAVSYLQVQTEQTPRPNPKGLVVFRRYGDTFFLREIWPGYENAHLRTIESKRERELRRTSSRSPDTHPQMSLVQPQ